MTKLADVKSVQPDWFSRDNRKLFGDVSYKVLHGKQSHKPFLVRSTYQWSDMFGQEPTLRYRVNELKDDLEIGHLVDQQFSSIELVKDWLEDK